MSLLLATLVATFGASLAAEPVRVRRASALPLPCEVVWARVTSPAGIRHEMRPWLTMSFPEEAARASLDAAPVGEVLFTSRVRLFGLLPVERMAVELAVLEPGVRFVEVSAMRHTEGWSHARSLEPVEGGCRLTDEVGLQPRGRGRAAERTLAWFFRHRHQRLARWAEGAGA